MTMKAMIFPGQGAQFPGMGKDFRSAYPEADDIFQRADRALGIDLSRICFEGSEEEVNRTDICQPGILTTSIAILTVLEKRHGLKRDSFSATAGLSLGEYSALVFAGVLSFEDAVNLVARRGRYMQEDSDRLPSGMMTLIGADPETVEKLCAECAPSESLTGVLVAANFLGPGQIAISGAKDALDRAESRLKEFGIRMGIRLKVAGAFHSPLMQKGGEKLKADLAAVEFRQPQVRFAANVAGGYIDEPGEIRSCLERQVTSPVLWHDTMNRFIGDGVTAFFEPGPGKVLCGILKKIDRNLIRYNLDDPSSVENSVDGFVS